jgi:hypothetical protein
MKRAILFLACLFTTNAHADECVYEEPECCEMAQTFNYWNAGVGPIILIPNVGIGRRYFSDHYGWDISLNVGSVIYATSVQIMADALYIPNPQASNPLYLGAGVAFGGAFGSRFAIGAVAPDLLIGKELSNDEYGKTFIEAHLQVPTWAFGHRKKESIYFPLVTIKYGMSF